MAFSPLNIHHIGIRDCQNCPQRVYNSGLYHFTVDTSKISCPLASLEANGQDIYFCIRCGGKLSELNLAVGHKHAVWAVGTLTLQVVMRQGLCVVGHLLDGGLLVTR